MNSVKQLLLITEWGKLLCEKCNIE